MCHSLKLKYECYRDETSFHMARLISLGGKMFHLSTIVHVEKQKSRILRRPQLAITSSYPAFIGFLWRFVLSNEELKRLEKAEEYDTTIVKYWRMKDRDVDYERVHRLQ